MMAAIDITSIARVDAPSALRELRAWLIWKYEPHQNPGGKPRKVPYYVNQQRRQGVQGSAEDRGLMVTFGEARAAAAARPGFEGVGLALMPENDIVALDFDDCVDDQGVIEQWVVDLVGPYTYAEFSPSGHGVRAFFRGQLGDRKSKGFEVFSAKGYVTFTGRPLPIVATMGNEDTVADLPDEVLNFVRERFRRDLDGPGPAPAAYQEEPLGLPAATIQRCLDVLPTDLEYDAWLQVGMALHHETQGEGFDTWDAWSASSLKYTSREFGLERWRSFGKSHQGPTVTARTLVMMANEHGAGVSVTQAADASDFEPVEPELGADGKPKIRFQVEPAHVFGARPPPAWIVQGVVPQAGLMVCYGAPGSGKSFLVLDLVAAIATGRQWRGRRTQAGRVVYVAAEGAGGFRNRLHALAKGLDAPLEDIPIGVIADAPNLMLLADAKDLIAAVEAAGGADVIVIDTLAQVTPGADENSGQDMGKALGHCKRLHAATGALVLLVHHSGKDAARGARGWSGINGAEDAELEITKLPNGARVAKVTKQKDGEDGLQFGFKLEVVPLGHDKHGEPITSCVVVAEEVPFATLARPVGVVERVVIEVIQEIAKVQTKGIEVAAVMAEVVRLLPVPEEGKRDRRKFLAKRAIETLSTGDDAPYWLRDDGTLEVG
jgi:hypothetical protein